jgi:NAD/NADP transhydrogenase beta subunit
MQKFDVSKFVAGWFIGDFAETALRTKGFEVAYKIHLAGEAWPTHYHAIATEVNYLIEGKMDINGEIFESPCVFVIYPNEIARPVFHTDCKLIVVKTPSLPGDKYEVTD